MANLSKEWGIKSLTHKQILRVARMFDEGFGPAHISEKMRVSVGTVNNVRKKVLAAREEGRTIDWRLGA